MKDKEIVAAIEDRVMSAKTKDYSIWTIGITDDPDRRKSEHESDGENTKHWKQWRADTAAIARDVEKHLIDKGMKGGPGGRGSPNYVYIF